MPLAGFPGLATEETSEKTPATARTRDATDRKPAAGVVDPAATWHPALPVSVVTSTIAAPFTGIGAWLARETRAACELAALFTQVLLLAVRPSSWTRPVRTVLLRQIYFTGAQALTLAGILAVLVGMAVVLQARVWLAEVGQSALMGPLLTSVIVRELGPLLVSMLVLMRSGSAIATELGTMTVNREVRLIASLGIDPIRYLVLPRVVGFVVSVLCLDVLFTFTAFATGYLASLLTSLQAADPLRFTADVLAALRLADVLSPLLKCTLTPALIAAICCHAGLSCGQASTEVPKAATRALSGATIALFSVSVAVSAASYLL